MKRELDNFNKDNARIRSKEVYINEFMDIVKAGYGFNYSLSLNEQRLLYYIFAHDQVGIYKEFTIGSYVTKLRDYDLKSNEIYQKISNRIGVFLNLKMNFNGVVVNVFETLEYNDRKISYLLNSDFKKMYFPPINNKGRSFKKVPYDVLMYARNKYELNAYRILLQVSGIKKTELNNNIYYKNQYDSIFGFASNVYLYRVKQIIEKLNNSEILKKYFSFNFEITDKGNLKINYCTQLVIEKNGATFSYVQKRKLEKYFISPFSHIYEGNEVSKKYITPEQIREFLNVVDLQFELYEIYEFFLINCSGWVGTQNIHIPITTISDDLAILCTEIEISKFQDKLIKIIGAVPRIDRNATELIF